LDNGEAHDPQHGGVKRRIKEESKPAASRRPASGEAAAHFRERQRDRRRVWRDEAQHYHARRNQTEKRRPPARNQTADYPLTLHPFISSIDGNPKLTNYPLPISDCQRPCTSTLFIANH
jgi:hypothetical protein